MIQTVKTGKKKILSPKPESQRFIWNSAQEASLESGT